MRDGYINAMQVYPFSDGALYQVYAAPGQITDIALQPGEQLVGSGPVAAGDTVRWIIGDTESGTGAAKQIHILVKPTRPDLHDQSRHQHRPAHLPCSSCARPRRPTWPRCPGRIRRTSSSRCAGRTRRRSPAQPVATGVDISALNFRYEIEGDTPAWRPLRAFDDGSKVFIEFPSGIGQGEMPPLFVIGPGGDAELVNYRARQNYYVVDRLFAAAELRLGDRNSERRVRIVRTDGRRRL